MSARASFRKRRIRAQVRDLYRRAARGLAEMLPKGLYKRSLLIVILPMVLLQTAVTFAFMQHHFELVTRRLSEVGRPRCRSAGGPLSRAPAGRRRR